MGIKKIKVNWNLEYYKERYPGEFEKRYLNHLQNQRASEEKPIKYYAEEGERKVWMYKGDLYTISESFVDSYNDEELKLLILEQYDNKRRRFERLRNKFDTTKDEKEELKRPRIPEEIRIKVWQRDDGKCARCGSREKLEYDHIVPISRGGSNTLRNIELLCEECNRSKSNKIGG